MIKSKTDSSKRTKELKDLKLRKREIELERKREKENENLIFPKLQGHGAILNLKERKIQNK